MANSESSNSTYYSFYSKTETLSDGETDYNFESASLPATLPGETVISSQAPVRSGGQQSVPSAQSSAVSPTSQTSSRTEGAASNQTDFTAEVIRLTNLERQKNGFSSLKSDNTSLSSSAQIRVGEIRQIFSHTRPDGSEFYTVIDRSRVPYRAAGENIASGQRTPEQVVEGWMNSPGHRQNILNPDFNYIGVGYDSYNWVQLFAKI